MPRTVDLVPSPRAPCSLRRSARLRQTAFDHACRLAQVVHDEVGADVAAGSRDLGAPSRSGPAASCSRPVGRSRGRMPCRRSRTPREDRSLARARPAPAARCRACGTRQPSAGTWRADVDGAQVDAGLGARHSPGGVDRIQRALGEVSAPHPGLVGDDDQLHAQIAQMAQSVGGAGERARPAPGRRGSVAPR